MRGDPGAQNSSTAPMRTPTYLRECWRTTDTISASCSRRPLRSVASGPRAICRSSGRRRGRKETHCIFMALKMYMREDCGGDGGAEMAMRGAVQCSGTRQSLTDAGLYVLAYHALCVLDDGTMRLVWHMLRVIAS